MKVRWQMWMLWIDKKTGEPKPNAPAWVVERYNKYMEERRKYEDIKFLE